MTAAYHAARAGQDVVLVDSRRVPGEKILLSGGGRCNVLPIESDPHGYATSSSPNTLRKIVQSWPLAEVRKFLEVELGVRLVEQKRTGKVFPATGGGEDVRERFLAALRRKGVRIVTRAKVVEIRPSERRRVMLESGAGIVADQVVLATGGLSYPRTGSDGSGLRIAAALGHRVVPTYPALVPLRNGRFEHTALAGVSLPVRLEVGAGRTKAVGVGDFLFTHVGYSGPVVLNMSHHVTRVLAAGERLAVRVAWLDRTEADWLDVLSRGRGTLRGILKQDLPDRLVDKLLDELDLWDAPAEPMSRETRARVLAALTAYPLPWVDSCGYREAEATGGGIPLSDVDPKTLQSRIVPCLHFAGEILDAVGPLGGHNFLWAFATGRLAGEGAAAVRKA